ncbi:MAG TPA: uracil-DNA glycosylase, partial [Fodinibius sp.]|nr:uracil-DNA glycosylase [Fodinibius sp.]
KRTSKPSIKKKGMTEPTATIMWKALYKLGIDPYEVVLWNALAWHPYNPDDGMLSNRTPTDHELQQGYPSLEAFLGLFPDAQCIAVGRKCEQSLTDFGISYIPVRHPANGGAPKFRRQMKELIKN